ncbi:hypothetical protein ACFL06_02080 [Patescibacteria group bacterium]
MKKSSIFTTFWMLVVFFLFILVEMFVPLVRDLFRGSLLFLWPFVIFSFLGVLLIYLTIKEKVERPLRKFLLLTGFSAAGVFIFSLLHNLVYGLGVYFFGENFWVNIGMPDEPLFFILAIIVSPIGFLIGVVGSIALLRKN